MRSGKSFVPRGFGGEPAAELPVDFLVVAVFLAAVFLAAVFLAARPLDADDLLAAMLASLLFVV
jgi:type IV secretory pathway TrbL component